MLSGTRSRCLHNARSRFLLAGTRLSFWMKQTGPSRPNETTFFLVKSNLHSDSSMTSGAQQALRRTMELYSSTTRFALACNNSSKIIEPIQSRCAILRYGRLTDKQLAKRLVEICDFEKVKYTPDGLEALIFTAEGDMRQAVNNLQSTFSGFGLVTPDHVFKVCDQPHPLAIQQCIGFCLEAKVDQATDIIRALAAQGYSSIDLVGTLFKVVKAYGAMPEYLKLEFIRVRSDRKV